MPSFLRHWALGCLAFLLANPTRGQRLEWARSVLRAPSPYNFEQLAVDRGGSSYVAGVVSPDSDSVLTPLGAVRYVGSGFGATSYLLQYDPRGQARWLRQMPNVRLRALAPTPTGGVLLAADPADSLRVGGTLLLPGQGAWLARYDRTGQRRWERALRLNGPDTSRRDLSIQQIATDAAGNTYLRIAGTAFPGDSLDNLPVALPGELRGGLVKLDAAGVVQWAVTVTAAHRRPPARPEADVLTSLTVDAAGNCYLTGLLADTVRLNTPAGSRTFGLPRPPYSYVNGVRGFVLKTDAAGQLAYLHETADAPQGSISFYLTSCSVDTAEQLYVGGFDNYGFVQKFSANGDSLWRRATTAPPGLPGIEKVFRLKLVGRDRLLASGDANGSLRVAVLDTAAQPSSIVEEASRFDGDDQTNLAGLWAAIGADSLGNAYLMAENDFPLRTPDGRFACGADYVPGWGSTLLKLNPHYCRLTGTVYLDANANGRRDTGEGPFPRPLVVTDSTRGYRASAHVADGQFLIVADTGRYALTLPHPPPFYTLTEGATGYAGGLPAYGTTVTGRDFGLTPTASRADVRVTLTPYGPARRGFANRYRARLENLGTTAVAGRLTVTLDTAQQYAGAVPAPAQQTGPTVAWNFQGLAPFGTLDFDLGATVPLNVALGTPVRLTARATVPGDLDPTNDADTVRQEVRGSFDPNDLRVSHTTITPAQVAAGRPLDYTVRFENLGNDTAFAVIITDTLPARQLDLNTLQVVSQSHNCWWDLINHDRLVLRFERIGLPPRGTSVLNAQGFVRFRVQPRRTLPLGTLIPNQAHIVFDFNPPLATNAVSTLVQAPNGLVAEAADLPWSLYPNPATDVTTVAVNLRAAGSVAASFTDALGRDVRRLSRPAPAGPLRWALPVAGLTPGVYWLSLRLPDGSLVTRKVVVRH